MNNKMQIATLSVLLISSHVLALPMPQDGATSASGAGDAIVDLLKSFAGVIEKAGSLVNKIADISNSTEVRRAGDEITTFADEMQEDTAEVVSDGFQKFLEYLPEIKSNINTALEKIPEIKTQVQEQISNIPDKETIKNHVGSLVDKLPESADPNNIKEMLHQHIDSLPSNSEINEIIDTYVDEVPSADYIQGKIDDYVDQAQDVVDGLNEAS